MSQNTVLPPEGPLGPASETPQEKSLFLSDSQDACDNPGDSPAPEADAPGDPPELVPEGQGSTGGEDSTGGPLVRTQPQRLPHPTASVEPGSGDGSASRSQNGRRVALSNGAGPEPRRHPSSTVSHKVQKKLQSSLSVHSDGSRKSRVSSAHKPGSSPEDCCVHCILACLFCEFLALCNMVVAQASCGACSPEMCCCCCGDELGDDCNCPCDMDCGIMDACCESSDCLEICMECCGICFPT